MLYAPFYEQLGVRKIRLFEHNNVSLVIYSTSSMVSVTFPRTLKGDTLPDEKVNSALIAISYRKGGTLESH